MCAGACVRTFVCVRVCVRASSVVRRGQGSVRPVCVARRLSVEAARERERGRGAPGWCVPSVGPLSVPLTRVEGEGRRGQTTRAAVVLRGRDAGSPRPSGGVNSAGWDAGRLGKGRAWGVAVTRPDIMT